jgi:hypothetical protein
LILLALVLAGVCLAAARAQARKVAVLWLVCILAFIALEEAVHSVHHLADPETARECRILSTVQHVQGTCAEGPDLGLPAPAAPFTLVVHHEGIRSLRLFRPDEGRAPPIPSV